MPAVPISSVGVNLLQHHNWQIHAGRISDSGASKTFPGHTDDRERISVEPDGAAYYARVCIESSFPEVVGENCNRMPARYLVIVGGEKPSRGWCDAKNAEVISGDEGAWNELAGCLLPFIRARHVQGPAATRRHDARKNVIVV